MAYVLRDRQRQTPPADPATPQPVRCPFDTSYLDRAEDPSAAEWRLQWHLECAENRDHGAHSADGIGSGT